MTIHANVTAYRGWLVIELLATASIADECHLSVDNPGSFGQVIANTEKHLGVSHEAVEILKSVKPGRDSLGDIDWFRSGDMEAFAWIGSPYRLVNPDEIETSRNWVMGRYVEIPNIVPDSAMSAVDDY